MGRGSRAQPHLPSLLVNGQCLMAACMVMGVEKEFVHITDVLSTRQPPLLQLFCIPTTVLCGPPQMIHNWLDPFLQFLILSNLCLGGELPTQTLLYNDRDRVGALCQADHWSTLLQLMHCNLCIKLGPPYSCLGVR